MGFEDLIRFILTSDLPEEEKNYIVINLRNLCVHFKNKFGHDVDNI